MKNHTIVFARTTLSETFPQSGSTEIVQYIKSTYSGNPLRLVGMQSIISDDLLTLTISRKFATDADATAFAQDPVIVEWLASLPGQTSGITAE
jgi:hypothetical protein